MIFEITFTLEAEETYSALSKQLEQRWGKRFVEKLESRVSKCLNTITSSPHLYPIIQETTEIRKCIIHKDCSMFYRIYDTQIIIIFFWDNRQDPMFMRIKS